MTQVFNRDCMEAMKEFPDKFFELAIVDPEFGIGIGKSPRLVTDKGLKAKSWDDRPIDPTYFTELFRVSTNQVIWGGNYYSLPANQHCIIWDKMQPETLSFGMFDYAWTSFDGSNKIFRQSVQIEKDKIHQRERKELEERKAELERQEQEAIQRRQQEEEERQERQRRDREELERQRREQQERDEEERLEHERKLMERERALEEERQRLEKEREEVEHAAET